MQKAQRKVLLPDTESVTICKKDIWKKSVQIRYISKMDFLFAIKNRFFSDIFS